MHFSRVNSSHPTSLGQLLVLSGAISDSTLEEALGMSKTLRMPSGLVMTMSGFISQSMLESALVAQSMVRNQVLNLESAISLLREAHHGCTSFEDILSSHGWNANAPTFLSELGELLVSATLLSRRELTSAIKEIQESGESLAACYRVT